jgi:hypothetical protein
MSYELLYTSAPRGLLPGSRGFCPVVATRGLPAPWIERLVSLSGYRALYPPSDPKVPLNPVVYSHVRVSLGGKPYNVLSRVCTAGLDYSERSNTFAHHVVLEANELPPAGPAWLLRQPGFMETAWDGQVRWIESKREVPRGESPPRVCRQWQILTGHAGWAGVVAETFVQDPSRPVYLVFQPGMDVLAMFDEVLSLLPADIRWQVTFSTYFTGLPQGVSCAGRGVLRGSSEAKQAEGATNSLVLFIETGLEPPADSPAVAAARKGKVVQADKERLPGVTKGRDVSSSWNPTGSQLDLRVEDPTPAPQTGSIITTIAPTSRPPQPPILARSYENSGIGSLKWMLAGCLVGALVASAAILGVERAIGPMSTPATKEAIVAQNVPPETAKGPERQIAGPADLRGTDAVGDSKDSARHRALITSLVELLARANTLLSTMSAATKAEGRASTSEPRSQEKGSASNATSGAADADRVQPSNFEEPNKLLKQDAHGEKGLIYVHDYFTLPKNPKDLEALKPEGLAFDNLRPPEQFLNAESSYSLRIEFPSSELGSHSLKAKPRWDELEILFAGGTDDDIPIALFKKDGRQLLFRWSDSDPKDVADKALLQRLIGKSVLHIVEERSSRGRSSPRNKKSYTFGLGRQRENRPQPLELKFVHREADRELGVEMSMVPTDSHLFLTEAKWEYKCALADGEPAKALSAGFTFSANEQKDPRTIQLRARCDSEDLWKRSKSPLSVMVPVVVLSTEVGGYAVEVYRFEVSHAPPATR